MLCFVNFGGVQVELLIFKDRLNNGGLYQRMEEILPAFAEVLGRLTHTRFPSPGPPPIMLAFFAPITRGAVMLAIVDYDAGNLRSVQRACYHVGIEAEITSDPKVVMAAERVIFPGVGAATSAVDTLAKSGLGDALKAVFEAGTPILGICLGSQIVLEHTEEDNRDCLGLIEGACQRFDFADRNLKVPHIGWNEIDVRQPHPLLRHVESGQQFYFVHSYYAVPLSQDNIVCTTNYGIEFCSAVGRDNLFASQFHLEKSGETGLTVLAEFANWDGTC